MRGDPENSIPGAGSMAIFPKRRAAGPFLIILRIKILTIITDKKLIVLHLYVSCSPNLRKQELTFACQYKKHHDHRDAFFLYSSQVYSVYDTGPYR